MGDVRGKGFAIGIELVANKETREPFQPDLQIGSRVVEVAMRNRFMCRSRDDVVTLFPALVSTHAEVAAMVEQTTRAIDEVLAALRRD